MLLFYVTVEATHVGTSQGAGTEPRNCVLDEGEPTTQYKSQCLWSPSEPTTLLNGTCHFPHVPRKWRSRSRVGKVFGRIL